MHRPPIGNLVPLGLEIEATIRRNRAERRRKLLQDRTIASILEEEAQSSDSASSYSLSSRESTTDLPEASVMAEEHQHRVTLEDYSSSSVPQFFKSIAWPKVLAHNINYPHSLNHLIQGYPIQEENKYKQKLIFTSNKRSTKRHLKLTKLFQIERSSPTTMP